MVCPCDASGGKAEAAALPLPFEGQCAHAPEAPRGKVDGLAASEYGFNDVGCQEGELKSSAHVARVYPLALCDLLDGLGCFPRQLAEPLMRPNHEGDQIFVGGGGFALSCAEHQLRFDPPAL